MLNVTTRRLWVVLQTVALIVALAGLPWLSLERVLGSTVSSASNGDTVKIAWLTDFDAAVKQARHTARPVLIDFTASLCPPCQVMKHHVWPDPEVRDAVMKHTVPLLIDVDVEHHALLIRRYQVASIPAVPLIDAEGNVLRRMGFMNKQEVLAFVRG